MGVRAGGYLVAVRTRVDDINVYGVTRENYRERGFGDGDEEDEWIPHTDEECSKVLEQEGVQELCMMVFRNVTIPEGRTAHPFGARSLAIVAVGTMTVAGEIDMSAHSGEEYKYSCPGLFSTGTYNYTYIVINKEYPEGYKIAWSSFVVCHTPEDVKNTGVKNKSVTSSARILLEWSAINKEKGILKQPREKER